MLVIYLIILTNPPNTDTFYFESSGSTSVGDSIFESSGFPSVGDSILSYLVLLQLVKLFLSHLVLLQLVTLIHGIKLYPLVRIRLGYCLHHLVMALTTIRLHHLMITRNSFCFFILLEDDRCRYRWQYRKVIFYFIGRQEDLLLNIHIMMMSIPTSKYLFDWKVRYSVVDLVDNDNDVDTYTDSDTTK